MTVTTLVDLPFNDDSQQVLTVLSITFTIYTRTSFGLNSAGILATSLFVTKIQRYAQFHFLKIPNFSKKILNCSCRTKHVNNYLYIYGDSFCTLYIVECPVGIFLKLRIFKSLFYCPSAQCQYRATVHMLIPLYTVHIWGTAFVHCTMSWLYLLFCILSYLCV